MSGDVHYSNPPAGEMPKRFLCGRKCRERTWTRVADFVDCPQCRAKLLLERKARDAAQGDVQTKEKS